MLCPYIKFKMLSLQRVGRITMVMMTAVTRMEMSPVWTRSPKYHEIHQRVVAANPAVLSTDPEVQCSFSLKLTSYYICGTAVDCVYDRQTKCLGFLCHIFCTYFSVEDINPNLCWSSHAVFTISLRAFSTSRCLLVNGQQLWRLSPLVRHTQCWWEGRLCVCQLLWRPS